MSSRRHVVLVVLGDVGRSPRMSYHALSLARSGFTVTLLGSRGSQPQRALLNDENISISYLPQLPDISWLKLRALQYVLKVLLQSVLLLYSLMLGVPRATHYLVQNPPTIPVFYVVWLTSLIRRAEFIIDWHNFGYTILALTLGENHPFVKINRWIERVFGRRAEKSLCVSEAMRRYLVREWGIKDCSLLYDTPGERFTELTLEEKHWLFNDLAKRFRPFRDGASANGGNVLTELDSNGKVKYRVDRPAVLLSSTSWTEDEDFSILLSALTLYNERKCEQADLPRLLCCITGKGPLKEYYEEKIAALKLRHIDIVLPWLEADEYPRLVGAADVGVCLHTSSSGLDLPMKVVDMFGCNLPVLAIGYQCIGELVEHDRNGMIFQTDRELVQQLITLLTTFNTEHIDTQLLRYRQYLREHYEHNSWHPNWMKVARPLFD